jgi:hypothetical protein
MMTAPLGRFSGAVRHAPTVAPGFDPVMASWHPIQRARRAALGTT